MQSHTTRVSCILSIIFAASAAGAHEFKLKNLEIVHPNTVEPADPKAKDVIVRMTIHNHGKEAEQLLSASSALAGEAVVEAAPDTPGKPIDVPAGGTVEFSSKGPHIELKDLKDRLTGYEMFPMSLTFAKAGKVEVEVLVEENEDAMTDDVDAKHQGGSKMKTIASRLLLILVGIAFAAPAFAHGDEPHPKCKKGYVLTEDHRCVKK